MYGAKQIWAEQTHNASTHGVGNVASSAVPAARRGDVMLTHGTWVALSLHRIGVLGDLTKNMFLMSS